MTIRHIRTVIAEELFICIRLRNPVTLIRSRSSVTLIRSRDPVTLKRLLQSFMHLDLHFICLYIICLRKLYIYRNGNKNNISIDYILTEYWTNIKLCNNQAQFIKSYKAIQF